MKPLPVLILVGVFATILGLAVWLLDDGPAGDGPEALTGLEPVAAEDTARDDALLEADTREATTLAPIVPDAPLAEPLEDVIPASYRAALGGLTGRVLEEDGAPVVDIPVALGAGGPSTVFMPQDAVFMEEFPELDPLLGETRTDEQGRFVMRDIEPRVLGVVLVDLGGPRATFRILQTTPSSGELTDIGDIVLPAGVTISGTIVDERDAPIAGARVRLPELPPMILQSGVADFRIDGAVLVEEDSLDRPFVVQAPKELQRYEQLLPFPTTYTDSEGRFELAGVKPGQPTLVVDDGVHLSLVEGPIITGPAGNTRDLGEVVMPDGESIVVAVYDDQDEPVVGAEVLAGNRLVFGPVSLLKGGYVTGEDGRVAVPGLRTGTVNAVARRVERDAFSVGQAVPTGGGQELRVVLEGLRTLTLELRDPDGELVQGAQILGRVLPDDDADDLPDMFLRPTSLEKHVSVDEDGRYVLAGLAPGWYDLVIRAEGYAVLREGVQLTFSDTTETFELQPSLEHEFLVFEADGETPVEHALTLVYESERERQVTMSRTDAEGRATVGNLVEGDYRVELSHPGLAIVVESFSVPSEEPTTILLPVGGSIFGITVDKAGRPPESPLMVLLNRQGRGLPGSQMPRMTMTDFDGVFEFHDVDPGDVEVSVREPIDDFDVMNWWEPFAMSPLAEKELTIASAEELETTLILGSATDGMDTGRVSGRIFVNGRPALGWKVRTWGQIRRTADVAADGSFDMGELAAGNVVLMIGAGDGSMPGGGVETHSFELEADGAQYVELDLQTGRVRGRVFSELTNGVVEGAQVTIREATPEHGMRNWWGGRRQVALAGADGGYEFEHVIAGSYVVSAEAEGYSRLSGPHFDVQPVGLTQAPDLRLHGAVRVSGTVVFQGVAETPDWVWMTASDENGNSVYTRADSESGEYTFDDMAPGTWTISANGSFDQELLPTTLVVSRDAENVLLRFEPKPPPTPEELAEQQQVLETLGYVGEG